MSPWDLLLSEFWLCLPSKGRSKVLSLSTISSFRLEYRKMQYLNEDHFFKYHKIYFIKSNHVIVFFSHLYTNHHKRTVVPELGLGRQCNAFLGTHREFSWKVIYIMILSMPTQWHFIIPSLLIPSHRSSVQLELSHEEEYSTFPSASKMLRCSQFTGTCSFHSLVVRNKVTYIFFQKRMLILNTDDPNLQWFNLRFFLT